MWRYHSCWMVVTMALMTACEEPASRLPGGQDADTEGGVADAEDAPGEIETEAEAPDTGHARFAVTAVRPNHGPFLGGSTVFVRGRGFRQGAVVYFGDHMVQLPDTEVLNDNEIAVVTPAGPVGPVEVRVEQGNEIARLPNGFTYDPIAIDPMSGSVAGGTFVTITGSGTQFAEGDQVFFDLRPATDVVVVSAERITCRTPPGAIGPADVTIRGVATDLTIRGLFTYFLANDPANGGLGGGPIGGPGTRTEVCPPPGSGGGSNKRGSFKSVGTINVTVLDIVTRAPIAQAFVLLGTEADTTYQGLTDARGMIVFSEPDLSGRQIITVAKEGYETTSIQFFDATQVTIFLVPNPPPPTPGEMLPPPPPRLGALIRGELIFESGAEFGRGPWDIVPEPGPDEEKVAYVYATSWDIWNEPPPPNARGAENRVTEETGGVFGYSYEVFARPGTVAVVAVAGLERTTGDNTFFTPYGMGVARRIITGPGETVEGVDIYMVHPMDVTLEIDLVGEPEVDPLGSPNTYRIDVFLDLGGDGVFWSPLRSRHVTDVSRPVMFPGWVMPNGELSDATYTIVAGAYNRIPDPENPDGMIDANPLSVVISRGHRDVWNPLVVDKFIGIPYAIDPAFGDSVQGNRMIFGSGPVDPDFWMILIETLERARLWRIVLPGCVKEFELPPVEMLAGLAGRPAGFLAWTVFGISSPGFAYDEWSYRLLWPTYWSAYAADLFIFQFGSE